MSSGQSAQTTAMEPYVQSHSRGSTYAFGRQAASNSFLRPALSRVLLATSTVICSSSSMVNASSYPLVSRNTRASPMAVRLLPSAKPWLAQR